MCYMNQTRTDLKCEKALDQHVSVKAIKSSAQLHVGQVCYNDYLPNNTVPSSCPGDQPVKLGGLGWVALFFCH